MIEEDFLKQKYSKNPSLTIDEYRAETIHSLGENIQIRRVLGLQKIIRNHIKLAEYAATWIDEDPEFELVSPRSLSLLNFRFRPKNITKSADIDLLNEDLLNRLNDSGRVYFTQNRVRGKFTIRWSIGQTNTQLKHVENAWSLIKRISSNLNQIDSARINSD